MEALNAHITEDVASGYQVLLANNQLDILANAVAVIAKNRGEEKQPMLAKCCTSEAIAAGAWDAADTRI